MMSATPSKPPKIKPHANAFWEALVRRGVTPEQAAPHLPDLSEFEIAGEMTKACRHLAETAEEQRLQDESTAAERRKHRRRTTGVREHSSWGYPVSSSKGIRR